VTDPMAHAGQIAAMAALAGCGAFDEILRRPATAAELAARFSLDGGALRRALEVARALGFLQEQAGVYAPREGVPGGAALLLRIARQYPEHLSTGASLTRDAEGRGQLYSIATPTLATMFRASAEHLADALARLPCRAILDVGAGSGVWSLAMAARHPGAVVSALDLAPVLDRFREAAGDRPHECIPGDYGQVALEPRWDRVVLANIIHLESESDAQALLARAAAWRTPGGSVVVIDSMFRDETSDLALASYELHLALRVAGGQVHEAGTIESWAHALDLEVESSIVLDPGSGMGALVLR
jgi:hypothetical protein